MHSLSMKYGPCEMSQTSRESYYIQTYTQTITPTNTHSVKWWKKNRRHGALRHKGAKSLPFDDNIFQCKFSFFSSFRIDSILIPFSFFLFMCIRFIATCWILALNFVSFSWLISILSHFVLSVFINLFSFLIFFQIFNLPKISLVIILFATSFSDISQHAALSSSV